MTRPPPNRTQPPSASHRPPPNPVSDQPTPQANQQRAGPHPTTQAPAIPQPSQPQATSQLTPDTDPAGSSRRPDLARLVSGAILAGLGGAVARAVLDGSYTAYVRPVMRLPLALAALILIVAGLAGCVSGLRPATGTPAGDEHGHRDGIPRAALIALVPLAVLAILRPPPLDDAATESVAPAASSQSQQDTGIEVQPLAGDPDVPKAISFNELTIRANAGNGPATLRGRMLLLEGFVAKNQDGVPAGLVRVGRYMIWCCAADAAFGEAFIRWPTGTPAPAAGSWFRIIGRVQDVKTFDGLTVPVVNATRAQAEPPLAHPYEY